MPTFCSMISCSKEKETIVGTSTSCSAVCGVRRRARAQREGRETLGTSKPGRQTAYRCEQAPPPSGPPSAARNRREQEPEERRLQSAPRCAAEPAPAAAAHPEPAARRQARLHRRPKYSVLAALGEGVVWPVAFVHFALLPPGPGLLLALCAVVSERGQGHAYGLLFVTVPRTLPPLCCAAPNEDCQLVSAMQIGHQHKSNAQPV